MNEQYSGSVNLHPRSRRMKLQLNLISNKADVPSKWLLRCLLKYVVGGHGVHICASSSSSSSSYENDSTVNTETSSVAAAVGCVTESRS